MSKPYAIRTALEALLDDLAEGSAIPAEPMATKLADPQQDTPSKITTTPPACRLHGPTAGTEGAPIDIVLTPHRGDRVVSGATLTDR